MRTRMVRQWTREMETHECDGKKLVPSDVHGAGDIPVLGYRCVACGDLFEIEVRDLDYRGTPVMKAQIVRNMLRTRGGRDSLGEIFSRRPVRGGDDA